VGSVRTSYEGDVNIRISGVETYVVGNPWKNRLFVRLTTDEGLYGIGNAQNGFARTVEAEIHELEHLYVGMSPFAVEAIAPRMLRDAYSDGGQIQGSDLAAVETACWDIIDRATGQPLYYLIEGRCHDRLRRCTNGWYRGPRTPESFYEKASHETDIMV
jgi:galactonate dehydratase